MIPSTLRGLGALGTDYRVDCTSGLTIDCDAWSNIFNQTCWGMCSAGTLGGGAVVGGSPPPPAPTGFCSWFSSLCNSEGKVSTVAIVGIGAVAATLVYALAKK